MGGEGWGGEEQGPDFKDRIDKVQDEPGYLVHPNKEVVQNDRDM